MSLFRSAVTLADSFPDVTGDQAALKNGGPIAHWILPEFVVGVTAGTIELAGRV
jgi:hypothetical protein